MNRTNRTIVTATAALGLILTSASGASADAHTESHHHRQQYSVAPNHPTAILGQECTADGHLCALPFFGYDTYTGDINGNQVNAGAVVVDPTTFKGPAVSLANFTGTISGCPGPGSAILRYTAELGVTPGHNAGNFEVVANTGTAGLAGLHGHGTFLATVHTDGTITSTGHADLTCDRQ